MQTEANLARDARAPSRLRRDPILEAICEIRFDSESSNLAALLPGLLFKRLGSSYPRLERLPVADLPVEIRDAVPDSIHQPHFRLHGDMGIVQIAERKISVASAHEKYPGWTTFRPLVCEAWNAVLETGLITAVNRVSVKFVNMLDISDEMMLSDVMAMRIHLGEAEIGLEPFQFTTETASNDHISVLQIVNPAKATFPNGSSRTGMLLDVDTIKVVDEGVPTTEVGTLLDAAHDEEKRVFFSLLTQKTMDRMEPEYD